MALTLRKQMQQALTSYTVCGERGHQLVAHPGGEPCELCLVTRKLSEVARSEHWLRQQAQRRRRRRRALKKDQAARVEAIRAIPVRLRTYAETDLLAIVDSLRK